MIKKLFLLWLFVPLTSFSGKTLTLQYPIPNGWNQVYHVTSKKNTIKEYIPVNQTLQEWTQMQTIIELEDLPKHISPKHLIEKTFDLSSQHCKNFSKRMYGISLAGEHAAAQGIQYCGKYSATGFGEITMIKAIKADKMYVIQMAWRGEAFMTKKSPLPRALLNEWLVALNRVKLVSQVDSKTLNSTIKIDAPVIRY